MIAAIVSEISSLITTLPFVDRYGGLVVPAERVDVNDFGTKVVSRFPVSISVNNTDCWEKGRYRDLIPDSTKKSIFYFEDRSGISLSSRSGKVLTFSGELRLVGWLNLPLLGESSFLSVTPYITLQLLDLLDTSFYPNSGSLDGATIKIKATREVQKNQSIFSAWTYDAQVTQFLLYPFDYFAIDISFEVHIGRGCITEYQPKLPVISCVNLFDR